jgi:outer membrane biosynthesis protein TonB
VEAPLIFLQVDPMQAAPDAPKDAKYYSDKNSLAANPSPDRITGQAKLDGTQRDVPSTLSPAKPSPQPPQPAPTPAPPTPDPRDDKPVTEAKARPQQTARPVGDLARVTTPTRTKLPDALAPQPLPGRTTSTPGEDSEDRKPRRLTVAEMRARQQSVASGGPKMRQDGGVERRLEFSALDGKATPFGAYDAKLVAAVQWNWYAALDKHNFARRAGKVVVEFRLKPDGDISNVKIAENEVGEILGIACQSAIETSAKFDAWPSDLRRMIGQDHRDVRFTFYYY